AARRFSGPRRDSAAVGRESSSGLGAGQLRDFARRFLAGDDLLQPAVPAHERSALFVVVAVLVVYGCDRTVCVPEQPRNYEPPHPRRCHPRSGCPAQISRLNLEATRLHDLRVPFANVTQWLGHSTATKDERAIASCYSAAS